MSLKTSSTLEKPRVTTCMECGSRLVAENKKRYCSEKCRWAFNNRRRKARHVDPKCAYCSKGFTKVGKRICCSETCQKKRDNQNRLQRYHADTPKWIGCVICRAEINVYGSWPCCSKKCHDKYDEVMARRRPCVRCKKLITRPRLYRFCSDECREEVRAMRKANSRTSRAFTVGTCLECGERITKEGQKTYCSRECREKHHNYWTKRLAEGVPVKECQECGKVLGRDRVRYCSYRCRVTFNAKKDVRKAVRADNRYVPKKRKRGRPRGPASSKGPKIKDWTRLS